MYAFISLYDKHIDNAERKYLCASFWTSTYVPVQMHTHMTICISEYLSMHVF